uniref:Putative cation efflux system protein cusB n=1 Tax=Magnetococcus massalia (strain MO-1) TaxID=451514 RepID=A0A1S7LJ90_MAGMO|nr:Putative cation efflux system protein cusB [Candidatus Magnetococcus massalia]
MRALQPLLKLFILGPFCLLLMWSANSWAAEEKVRFTCPMHPHYIAEEMGACPLCGMDLVPMAAASGGGAAEADERAKVTIAPEVIQNMGVRYGAPQMTAFGRRIRAFGMVMENQRAQQIVSSRVAGWVEKLHVTAVGDRVGRGMVLYRLFSPDLIAAQRDYLGALRQKGDGRLRSAAQRLHALGVDSRFIAQLKKSGKLVEKVPFYAASSGRISKLNIRQGSYIKPGISIATVQDYSSVWLNASVAEKDLPLIHKETPVKVMLPNLPGREVKTRIDYIYPTMDAASRTGTIRLLLDNRDGKLRPGAYADVVFEVGIDRRLALPSGALLNDAQGFHVVVALGEGRFQPRAVKVGLTSGGYTEILEGLKESDRVVTSGQFMIDSESALQESFAKLERLKTPLDMLELSGGEMAMVDHMVDAALYIHEAVVDGYDVEAQQLQPARDIKGMLWPRYGQTRLGPILTRGEQALAKAQKARTEQELLVALHELTLALQPWLQGGPVKHYQEKQLFLLQTSRGEKRLWLQVEDNDPSSPYGDSSGGEVIPLQPAAEQVSHEPA